MNGDEPHLEAELLLSAEVTGCFDDKAELQELEPTALKPTLLMVNCNVSRSRH